MKQNSKSLKTLSIIFIIFGLFETFLGVFGGVAGLNEELWQQVSEVTSDLGSYVLFKDISCPSSGASAPCPEDIHRAYPGHFAHSPLQSHGEPHQEPRR